MINEAKKHKRENVILKLRIIQLWIMFLSLSLSIHVMARGEYFVYRVLIMIPFASACIWITKKITK